MKTFINQNNLRITSYPLMLAIGKKEVTLHIATNHCQISSYHSYYKGKQSQDHVAPFNPSYTQKR